MPRNVCQGLHIWHWKNRLHLYSHQLYMLEKKNNSQIQVCMCISTMTWNDRYEGKGSKIKGLRRVIFSTGRASLQKKLYYYHYYFWFYIALLSHFCYHEPHSNIFLLVNMNGSTLSKDWKVELLGHICKLLSEIAVLIYTPLRNCLFSIPPLVDTIKIIDFYQADISRKWYIGAFFFE